MTSPFYGPHPLAVGQPLRLCFGPLTVRLERDDLEWNCSWERNEKHDGTKSVALLETTNLKNEEDNLIRCIFPPEQATFQLSPELPELDLLVKLEHAIQVAPYAKVRVYVTIPLILA